MFITPFEVFFGLLLQRPTVTWGLFVLYDKKAKCCWWWRHPCFCPPTDRKKQSKCLLLSAHHHINLYIHISIQYPPYSQSDAFNYWCYLKLITIIVKIYFLIWLTMITCYQFLIVYHRWIKTLRQEGGWETAPMTDQGPLKPKCNNCNIVL